MVKNSIILFAFLFIFNSFIAHAANQDFSDQNFIDDYLPTNADGTINAVIEIPAGTNEKWEVTKPDGKLELEKEDGWLLVVFVLYDINLQHPVKYTM